MSAAPPEGESCSGRPVCGTAEASRDVGCRRRERRRRGRGGASEGGAGKRGRRDTEIDLNEIGGAGQGRAEPEEAGPRSQRRGLSEGSEVSNVFESLTQEQGKNYLWRQREKNKIQTNKNERSDALQGFIISPAHIRVACCYLDPKSYHKVANPSIYVLQVHHLSP